MLQMLPENECNGSIKKLGQPADAKLTIDLGKEVCRRAGADGVVNGSLVRSREGFVITISAINCRTEIRSQKPSCRGGE